MTITEYRRKLHQLMQTCEMNRDYHQHLEHYWSVRDKGIRIAVGALAVASLVASVPDFGNAWFGFTIALVALIVAGALNIVPVGDWEKHHGEMFRLWSDLCKDVVAEDLKTCDVDDTDKAAKAAFDRLCELVGKAQLLNASEKAPDRALLLRFQEDANEREWGTGIRTCEQVEQERIRRLGQFTSASVAEAEAASAADPA